jgi:hypothetical protein
MLTIAAVGVCWFVVAMIYLMAFGNPRKRTY